MAVTVAHLGARLHYAVPRILHSAGLLDHFFTDIYLAKGWPPLLRIIPERLRPPAIGRLLGRVPEGVPAEKISGFTRFGLVYATKLAAATTTSERTAVYLWAGQEFDELILNSTRRLGRVIYGLNGASERLFEQVKRRDSVTLLEQTIAPRAIELELLGWDQQLANGWRTELRDDYAGQFVAREKREWELADIVVCASDFVREGVIAAGGEAAKCVVVPYGVEMPGFEHADNSPKGTSETLNVLFVGSVGLRKGVPYLLEAMAMLAHLPVRCRIVGGITTDRKFLISQCPPNVELVGAIPRSGMQKEYQRADVLCLPTLCEGSATAVYEALASGVPVITTANAGSIVRHEKEGLIVPVRDSAELAKSLERLNADRYLLGEMSVAARARSRFGSMTAYSERLLGVLASLSHR